MKYWFFNGSDVTGPFTPKELAADKSFNAASLVCPEEFSDQEDQWRPAASFAQLQPWIATEETEEAASLTLEEEMNTLLQEKSPLAFEKTTTDGPSLQLPKKPAKPGPIEDYFNHIQKEELGDILGIPDPADNSDMDLAKALERQLAKTSSTRREEQALNAADEQTVQNLQTQIPTHHAASITEVFGPFTPAQSTAPAALQTDGTAAVAAEPTPAVSVTQPPAQPASLKTTSPAPSENTLPTLPADGFAGMPTADTAPVVPIVSSQPIRTEPVQEAPVRTEPTPEPVQEAPVHTEPVQEASAAVHSPAPELTEADPVILPDPARLRSEKIEVNSVRTHLKQTQEMKEVIRQAVQPRPGFWERKATVFLLAVLVIMGSIFIIRQFPSRPAQAAPASSTAAAGITTAQELLDTPPTTVSVPAVTIPADRRQQALDIVQNYPLSGARGTIEAYLNRLYQTQLSQGYTAAWEAEPLHKNAYLVKYRLTKTRKEPIIYIFQADVDTGKLTGALNNISLDLVGKI